MSGCDVRHRRLLSASTGRPEPEPHLRGARGGSRRGAPQGGDLAALALLPYEVANVAAAKLRRRLVREAHAEAAIALLGRLEVTLYQVAAPKLLQVAGRTGLTAYDAAYLSVARALRADLVTLDVKLGRAFRRMH